MKSTITSGKTLDEAIRLATIELDTTPDRIEYIVLEEGTKGFLGFGSKEVKIQVTRKDTIEDVARDFLSDLFAAMGFAAEMDITLVEEQINIEVRGGDMAVLIGKHGQTLDSVQYLLSLVINKHSEQYTRVSIDTEGYREKRKEALESLAERLAARVRKSRKSVVLEPMNPYERRIIHTFLQTEQNVGTRSEGLEPNRRVVIYYDGRRKS